MICKILDFELLRISFKIRMFILIKIKQSPTYVGHLTHYSNKVLSSLF